MTFPLDYLFTNKIRKDHEDVDGEEILSGFKEFCLIFYGAAWSTRSMQVANCITNLMADFNPDDDHSSPLFETIYISNDMDKKDYKDFYAQMVEETSWCTLKW